MVLVVASDAAVVGVVGVSVVGGLGGKVTLVESAETRWSDARKGPHAARSSAASRTTIGIRRRPTLIACLSDSAARTLSPPCD